MINLQELIEKLRPEMVGISRRARFQDGWLEVEETASYASASSITMTVDVRAMIVTGARIRIMQSSAWKYFIVTSTSLDMDDAITINLTGGSDYTVANEAISRVQISYMSGAQPGWPGWFKYAPTETGWTSMTANVARFCPEGRKISLALRVTGTSDSTSAEVSLPVTAASVYGTSAAWSGMCGYCQDNGTGLTSPARWVINSAGSVVLCYKDAATTAWTASGTKFIMLECFYEF